MKKKTTLLGPWIKVNLCLFCVMFLAIPTIVHKALYLAKNALPFTTEIQRLPFLLLRVSNFLLRQSLPL